MFTDTTAAGLAILFMSSFASVRHLCSRRPWQHDGKEFELRTAAQSTLSSIDPLVTNFLLDQQVDHDDEDKQDVASTNANTNLIFLNVGGLSTASDGLRIWRAALNKGRLPLPSEFEGNCPWPEEPLFARTIKVMVDLQLPRFALRHPETISTILRSILRITVQFRGRLEAMEQERNELEVSDQQKNDDVHVEGNDFSAWDINIDQAPVPFDFFSTVNVGSLADDVTGSFLAEWNAVVGGVNILDQLFGLDHNLLNFGRDNSSDPIGGFGIQDGIWKHSGWQRIPQLQSKLSSMSELKELVRTLGRRPTAEKSDRFHKFKPRKRNPEGVPGAEMDPIMRESVSGITFSSNLAEMLPCEAALLRSSSHTLRRLFHQKRAESKLLSYQMSGWADVPSVTTMRPLYRKRLPSAPGGPIIVALDTSWSMASNREQLSKAVVLACVSAAHAQKRECQVIAFSTERNVIESGTISADEKGIQRLLEFLSNSFGGGTDVTGALKYAMEKLDTETLSDADILLVTDGEIPDPPVSREMMAALDHLKLRKGVEVHGLLVGKTESKPLSRLCTHIHNFLNDYDDTISVLSGQTNLQQRRLSRLSYHRNAWSRPPLVTFGFGSRSSLVFRPRTTALSARFSYDDVLDEEEEVGKNGPRKQKKRQRQGGDNFEDSYAYGNDSKDTGRVLQRMPSNNDPFNEAVGAEVAKLMEAADERLAGSAWNGQELEKEWQIMNSSRKHGNDLKAAIDRVSEGLVERSEEARLVVLAMLANEHILLLGPPGTAKSVLGARLAVLAHGLFFQRLLTRFTTPEELFGPLSLRGLENDEYRRVSTGYLPTATVCFLDEIFKANSAILNTLLTILNERIFDNAGGQELCPLRCAVGASNELPESDELVALFDRFLIRKEVVAVSDEGLMQMLSMPNPGYSDCDNRHSGRCDVVFAQGFDLVARDLSSAAGSITMNQDACALVRDLRTFMREKLNVEISDRRLVKISRLLKLCAASHGRTRVDPIDCMVMQHCVWEEPEQRAAVREWLWDNITPGTGDASYVEQFRFLLDGLRKEVIDLVRKTSGDVTGSSGGRKVDIEAIKSLSEEVGGLVDILQQRRADLARHMELLRQSTEFLWLDPDEAKAMNQLLLPRAKSILDQVEEALSDAVALSLSIGSITLPNEYRLAVIEQLWEDGYVPDDIFTEQELSMDMREAKARYDLETFRKWKRAKKKKLSY